MSKRRLGITKVYLDELLYLDDAGEMSPLRAGEWVGFKRRISMKERRGIMNIQHLDEQDATADVAIAEALASVIVAWELSDLDGEPDADGTYPRMPKPTAESIMTLSDEEVIFLLQRFGDLLDTEAASKN